jgi:hypothetical protein
MFGEEIFFETPKKYKIIKIYDKIFDLILKSNHVNHLKLDYN